MNINKCFTTVLALAFTVSPALAQNHWVASWGAGSVTSSPATQDTNPPNGNTYRNITHMSLGGSQVRLTLSNRFGVDPLTIDDVSVAVSNGADAIKPATLQSATFGANNRASVTIQPGDTVFSNPVSIDFAAQADLAVSIHVPHQTITYYTDHPISHQTNYVCNTDQVNNTTLTNPTNFIPWHFLSAIDVQGPAADVAIVAVGDSITDGAGQDANSSNHRWPNYLTNRLYANGNYTNLAVVNEGIGSDRVLTDGVLNPHSGLTPSTLNRWQPDVLARAGVKYIILLEGVNDIDASVSPRGPHITAQDLINGYETLITQAHNAGLIVYMATMTPAGGRSVWTTAAQTMHDDANAWIRQDTANGYEDGFIEFEQAVWDPSNHNQYLPAYDSGDHLHPNDAGKQVMANAIALSLFN